jgi:hypothetical protein
MSLLLKVVAEVIDPVMASFEVIGLSILLLSSSVFALAGGAPAPFPPYLSDGFDYAKFTRFDAAKPPKTVIYQSNGFMALQERGFGGQKIIIPVAGSTILSNSSDRLVALEIDPPVFVDSSRRTYSMADSPAKRSMTYFADRTVYRVAFDDGPEVSLTVYPVDGKPDAVLRIKIVQSRDPMLVRLHSGEDGFQVLPNSNPGVISYGSLDGTEKEAEAALAELSASPDLHDQATHRDWNQYLASAPLVAPAAPVTFTIGTTGNLWSLQEMIYLSNIQGEDPVPWEQEYAAALKAVREKLWDPATERYWDLDSKTGKLWTQGENLDA